MSAGADLKAGLGLARRGAKMAWQNPEVRRTYFTLVAALVLVTTALNFGGIAAVLSLTSVDESVAWWELVALWLLRLGGIALVLLVAPVAALFAVNGVLPFLAERVFFAGLRHVAPKRAAELARAEGLPLGQALGQSLVRALLFVAQSLLLLLLAFVPVVGSLAAPALQLLHSTRALSWELLDPYFERLGLDRAAQREFVRRHQPLLIGFSAPFALLLAIPIVGGFAYGLAQAATATLVAERLDSAK